MIDLLSYINEDSIIELESDKTDLNNIVLYDACLNDLSDEIIKDFRSRSKSIKKQKTIQICSGFTLLHLRLAIIDKIRLVVGIPPHPLRNGKNQRIHAIFCIIIPDTKSRTYLSLMAHLVRLLSQPDAKQIFRPGNKKQIVKYIKTFEAS